MLMKGEAAGTWWNRREKGMYGQWKGMYGQYEKK